MHLKMLVFSQDCAALDASLQGNAPGGDTMTENPIRILHFSFFCLCVPFPILHPMGVTIMADSIITWRVGLSSVVRSQ